MWSGALSSSVCGRLHRFLASPYLTTIQIYLSPGTSLLVIMDGFSISALQSHPLVKILPPTERKRCSAWLWAVCLWKRRRKIHCRYILVFANLRKCESYYSARERAQFKTLMWLLCCTVGCYLLCFFCTEKQLFELWSARLFFMVDIF